MIFNHGEMVFGENLRHKTFAYLVEEHRKEQHDMLDKLQL